MTIHTTINRLIAAAKLLQAMTTVSMRPSKPKTGSDTRFAYLEMKGNGARLSCGDETIVLIQELFMDSPPNSDYRCLSFNPQIFSDTLRSIRDRRESATMTIQGNLAKIILGQDRFTVIEGKDDRPWPFWTYADPYGGNPEDDGKIVRYNTERLKIFFDVYKILNGGPPKGDLDIFMRGKSLPGIVNMGSGNIGLLMPLNVAEDPKIPKWLEGSSFAWEDLCGSNKLRRKGKATKGDRHG